MPDWPHAPPHRLFDRGAYFVTASTLHKALIFRDPDRLSLLQRQLLTTFRIDRLSVPDDFDVREV